MDKFRVGQKVRVIDDGTMINSYKRYLGREETIISVESIVVNESHYVLTNIHGPNNLFAGSHLSPLYDGDEKSSWSECIWNPHKVKA